MTKSRKRYHQQLIRFGFNDSARIRIEFHFETRNLERCRSMGFEDTEHRPQITFQRVSSREPRDRKQCEPRECTFPFSLFSSHSHAFFYSLTASFLLSFCEASSILLSVSGPIDRAAWEKAHGAREFRRRNDVLSRLGVTSTYLIRNHVTIAIIVTDDTQQ